MDRRTWCFAALLYVPATAIASTSTSTLAVDPFAPPTLPTTSQTSTLAPPRVSTSGPPPSSNIRHEPAASRAFPEDAGADRPLITRAPWAASASSDDAVSAAILGGAALDAHESGLTTASFALMLRWPVATPLELRLEAHVYRPAARIDLLLELVRSNAATLSLTAPISFFTPRDVGYAGAGLGLAAGVDVGPATLSASADASLARIDASISDFVIARTGVVPTARVSIDLPLAALRVGLLGDVAGIADVGALFTLRAGLGGEL